MPTVDFIASAQQTTQTLLFENDTHVYEIKCFYTSGGNMNITRLVSYSKGNCSITPKINTVLYIGTFTYSTHTFKFVFLDRYHRSVNVVALCCEPIVKHKVTTSV